MVNQDLLPFSRVAAASERAFPPVIMQQFFPEMFGKRAFHGRHQHIASGQQFEHQTLHSGISRRRSFPCHSLSDTRRRHARQLLVHPVPQQTAEPWREIQVHCNGQKLVSVFLLSVVKQGGQFSQHYWGAVGGPPHFLKCSVPHGVEVWGTRSVPYAGVSLPKSPRRRRLLHRRCDHVCQFCLDAWQTQQCLTTCIDKA
jgi:hypothetical protein